jgi:hypothetical protein
MLTLPRLVLYYPVSALVTLFANILQNPQDARARSDIKSMNVVVNFLSMLGSDESNGSVRRMLSVCAEFERITRVVVDKAEKEVLSKRKRKVATENITANDAQRADTSNRPGPTASGSENLMDATSFSPGEQQQQGTPASTQPTTQPPIGIVSPNPSDMMSGTFGDLNANMPVFNPEVSFADQPNLQSTSTTNTSPSDSQFYPFQPSFVPQDLWQMPMTLEWDWADFSTINLPNVDQPDMFQATMHNGR